MKKVSFLLLLLFLTGCGSLRISPQNCKSNAFWSSQLIEAETDEDTDEETDSETDNENKNTEIKKIEPMFIFFNKK